MSEGRFIIFSRRDEEMRHWAARFADLGTQAILLVPLSERAHLIRALLRRWEEEGDAVPFWLGSVWDVPVIRQQLKALRTQSQASVLETVNKSRQSQEHFGKEQGLYAGRDREALRCFAEMLEQSDAVMELDHWRELRDLCRNTSLEVGTWHVSAHVLTDHDPAPDTIDEVWIPQCVHQHERSLPRWVARASQIIATASRSDEQGRALQPRYDLAKKKGWKIEEWPETPEVKPEQDAISLSASRSVTLQGGDRRIYSVTELETYARSPYWYFAEKVLGLQPVRELAHELEAFEIGSIAHRVLEQFFRERGDEFAALVGDAKQQELLLEQLDKLLCDAVNAISTERTQLVAPLMERQQEKLRQTLRAVLAKDWSDLAQQKNALRPRYFEWSFGSGMSPPLEVRDQQGTRIRLKGRIDRIDVDPVNKTFLVVDYKTGSSRISTKDMEQGRALQLPLYIEAVRQLLLPEFTPIGAVFFSLSDVSKKEGMIRLDRVKDYFDLSLRSSSVMPPEVWEGLIEAAITHVGRIVTCIEAGEFPAMEKECAHFCPYRDMCRCREICN